MSFPDVRDYHIAWICASHEELMLARAMLDDEHANTMPNSGNDTNLYVTGRMHKHNIVISCLLDENDGASGAATVANNVLRTFTAVRFGLMVGVGCGLPNLKKGRDIRLGDVVVSKPSEDTGGVVQFNKTRIQKDGTFKPLGSLDRPSGSLLSALKNRRTKVDLEGSSDMSTYIKVATERYPGLRKLVKRPDELVDVLRCYHFPTSRKACQKCINGVVKRDPRESNAPQVHYGVIASGDAKVRSATFRDAIRDKFDAVCIESEAAGLMNNFKCLIIRGICDYADGFDNADWTNYAAATSAAFAKELLLYVSPEETNRETPLRHIVGR